MNLQKKAQTNRVENGVFYISQKRVLIFWLHAHIALPCQHTFMLFKKLVCNTDYLLATWFICNLKNLLFLLGRKVIDFFAKWDTNYET